MITNINEFKNSLNKTDYGNALKESIKQGKQYISSGKVSQDILNNIIEIDPTPTKKYVGWLTKQYTIEPYKLLDIKSYVEEFNVFLDKNKSDVKDINTFKNIIAFKEYIDALNNISTASLKELENDYDVILDNDDIYIASPNTHEASRKLGLTIFAHRDGKDSAWCTTYKNNTHFYNYFYKNNVTFYYVLVKNKKLLKTLGGDKMSKIAFAVLEDGQIDAYDANDTQINAATIKKITKLLGLA